MTDGPLLILVDPNDRAIGELDKESCHDDEGRLHRAFSIFLFDDEGRVLLQERSRHKRLWPRYWSNACCSHPRVGEDIEAAAHRRLHEELGISAPLTYRFKFEYHATYQDRGSEHELCSVFTAAWDGTPMTCNPEEVVAADWLTPTELDAEIAIDASRFTPWFLLEWERLSETASG